MSRDHRFVRCIFLFSLVCIAVPADASTYTFEGLNNGNLLGQDGWSEGTGSGIVADGIGVNTSKVVQVTSGGWSPNRTNDANYSFPAWTGTETQAYLELDLQFTPIDQASSRLAFYLQDSVNSLNQSPWLAIRGANFETRAARSGTVTIAAIGAAAALNDWVRLRLDLNLTANAGDGSMSLSYMNLMQGQVAFTPIVGLQNLAANFLANPGPNKYQFNQMWFRTDGLTGDRQADNLTVGVVPEPSAICLTAFGLIGLVCAKLGKRRRG